MWAFAAMLGMDAVDIMRSAAQVRKLTQELTDGDDPNVPQQLQQVQRQSKAASNGRQNSMELDVLYVAVGHRVS